MPQLGKHVIKEILLFMEHHEPKKHAADGRLTFEYRRWKSITKVLSDLIPEREMAKLVDQYIREREQIYKESASGKTKG